MDTFIESQLEVRFPPPMKAVKWDSHRFYRYMSGRGFKGVDFIVLDPDNAIFLVELKNYENAQVPSNEEMVQTFYEKCEDALHLLEIINSYYQRKLWVRLCYPRLPILLSKEARFWLECYHHYSLGKVILLGDYRS